MALVFSISMPCQTSSSRQAILGIEDSMEAGDLDKASRLTDDALSRYPNDGGVLNLRGVIHARRNELPQARQDFRDAVRFARALTPAWQNLGRACQAMADQDEAAPACALDAWKRVSILKPGDAEAHAALGLLYERKGMFSQSLTELQALPPTITSQTPNLLLQVADLAALGRTAQALKLASRLCRREDLSEDDFEGARNALDLPAAVSVAVPLLEALDSRHAASPAGLQQLAIAYEESNRPAEARKTLEHLTQVDPNNTAHLLELARLAGMSKDYEGALGYLAHARDLDPKNARIHFLFAMIAAKMDLPVEAKRSLQSALAIDPENPDYNYSMGVVILSSRDAAAASAYFEKFVKARPSSVSGHFALGAAYFKSGDYDKAKAEMLSLENGSKAAEAECFLGRIARLEGRPDEALRRLQKSVKLMPSLAESHTELARVYLLGGELEKVDSELGRALKLDPQSFQANSQLLVLYKRTHDPRAAQQKQLLAKLDEERSRRAELMLRTVEFRP